MSFDYTVKGVPTIPIPSSPALAVDVANDILYIGNPINATWAPLNATGTVLAGDVTGISGANTVSKIQGVTVTGTTGTGANVLNTSPTFVGGITTPTLAVTGEPQPAPVATTPGTVAPDTFDLTGAVGGSTTIATTGTGGGGASSTINMGAGGTAALAAVSSVGGVGGAWRVNGGVGGTATVAGTGNNLAAPGADDLNIFLTTFDTATPVLTFAGSTLNSGTASVASAHFAAFAGSSLHLVSHTGKWNVLGSNAVTFA